MATSSYTVANLIQGVSQQAPEQRRATQCEAQQNCLNSPQEGARARPSLEWRKTIDTGVDWANAAFYEIFRGDGEHYLAVIPSHATVGDIRVWDLVNYVECSVTKDGSQGAYLAVGSAGQAKRDMEFQTVDDYTFVANKTQTIRMTSDVQSTRPREALVFVKAGAYKQTYAVAVSYGGNRYIFSYKTPDNSAAGNAEYIATTAIASALYNAMTGTNAHQITSGEADSGNYLGVFGVSPTPGSGTITGTVTLTSLGFSVEIRGNVIRVWRAGDTNDFKIDCGDGTGNTYMDAIKDSIQSLDKLPQKAMVGFRIKVAGSSKTDVSNAYYVEYTADNVWQECLGAGVKTKLDKTLMPHALINTGFQTFSWVALDWDTRVAGDDTTAKLPYFVGKAVQDLFFFGGRLGILTEGAYDMSKNRNSFSFFPDTVQTVLATAPISNPLQGRKAIALMRKAVQADETLFFWAEQSQFRLSTGVEALKPDTAEQKPITSYSFAEKVRPLPIGSDMYFIVEPDAYANVKVISFSQAGRPSPAVSLTDHVPTYIKVPCKDMFADETRKMIFVRSEALSGLYVYNYLNQGPNIVQSAWQTWTFPTSTVLWASVFKGKLFAALRWAANIVVICTIDLLGADDPGGRYHTRLDMRCSEADVTMSYNSTLDRTTITLPYATPVLLPKVVIRTTALDYTLIRGAVKPVVTYTGAGVVVDGDMRDKQFYVGFAIESYIDLSEFFPRDLNGEAKLYEGVTVKRLLVSHAKTSYYKVVVTDDAGKVTTSEWSSRKVGVAGSGPDELNPGNGFLDLPVEKRPKEYTARLLNDSAFPSAWQRVKVTYNYVDRGARDPGM